MISDKYVHYEGDKSGRLKLDDGEEIAVIITMLPSGQARISVRRKVVPLFLPEGIEDLVNSLREALQNSMAFSGRRDD